MIFSKRTGKPYGIKENSISKNTPNLQGEQNDLSLHSDVKLPWEQESEAQIKPIQSLTNPSNWDYYSFLYFLLRSRFGA